MDFFLPEDSFFLQVQCVIHSWVTMYLAKRLLLFSLKLPPCLLAPFMQFSVSFSRTCFCDILDIADSKDAYIAFYISSQR